VLFMIVVHFGDDSYKKAQKHCSSRGWKGVCIGLFFAKHWFIRYNKRNISLSKRLLLKSRGVSRSAEPSPPPIFPKKI
jgi:hypothetical protein